MKTEFFPWKEEYSVKVKEIDDQHKVLIKLLNKLYDAFMKKEHSTIIGDIIQELTDYASYHFGTEEKYFKRFNYKESEKHLSEHKIFTEKVNEFKKEYEKNKSALTFTIINFLRDWLKNHILISDKKYSDFFAQNGIK
ncbi:MAG: hypothetical protein A2X13_02585 [Bacteroidetes bacterium GWC2_33_15]|nr:MAG: hypothetical protein A2X10_15030 [Bacteroidetes bacterium GWA2_33_15]OFX49378.1 MAG: hypothetical protein A2X13_02585 [Bacteroidetes bacterium GWC2_33_15]OFX63028.1 MAG: hypothetical protein A2X15_10285 [Bacteroidetes bacterium GWB2_32_14]OFX68727.1 MAG: hypothetical protein A2X14_14110 [Bacteroidetes bacterium GWD2_33_33]HAN19103.1 hemerythrin [Bacteroidales bacterium]